MWASIYNLSLNRKLMLLVMLTSITTLILSSSAMVAFEIKVVTELTLRELETLVENLAENGEDPMQMAMLGKLQMPNAKREADSLLTMNDRQDIVAARFLDQQGSIFSEYVKNPEELLDVNESIGLFVSGDINDSALTEISSYFKINIHSCSFMVLLL